jgi:probable DNA metabolism protein
MKKILIYDGTFDGFLTAVYCVFEEQLTDVEIVKPKHFQPNIFIDSEEIATDSKKAERVWQAVQLKVSRSGANRLHASFLSEIKGVENVLLRYILFAYCTESFSHKDYSNKDVLRVLQVSRMVYKERDRMEAVVKFQLTKDGIYFAAIEPDFNVLPLLLKHAKDKYPDREWVLFDRKRQSGAHYKDGVINWINEEEYFGKTSRYAKKDSGNSIFLDANHLRITRNEDLKSAI